MTDKKTVSLTSTVCRSEELLTAEIDNELVLMAVQVGNYYGLDVIAADIWRRLENPVAVAKLCEELVNEYDADSETINRDVLTLLEKLEKESLIQITS